MHRRVLSTGVSWEYSAPAITIRPPARLRGLNARDDLNKGRLAGSVLADEAMHFAQVKGEIDAVERPNPAESLRNVREF
jgi:hypothetical protein